MSFVRGQMRNVTIGSRSMAATHMMNSMRPAGRVPEHPALSPGGSAIPMTTAALPRWWKDVDELWAGALERCRSNSDGDGNKPLCMFYCTPRGCAAGEGACAGGTIQSTSSRSLKSRPGGAQALQRPPVPGD